MTELSDLRTLMKQRRRELGYTLRRLSTESGIHYVTLHEIEHNKKRYVSEEELDGIAIGLQLDRDLLYVVAGRWPPSVSRTQESLKKLYRK
ncbi:MAG: helix-turn-helix transcriptional regulator [Candidatus Aenigmarchaeota archaeon]|nr:helix-turn-helix transcriptional regulator [Candidatus Aenigmarchaeota archaeon]